MIGDLLKSRVDGDDARAPEKVRRAVARFIKERDGETRAEIDALRVANDAMRAEVDAIEMLQTLMDARRETSEARANVQGDELGGQGARPSRGGGEERARRGRRVRGRAMRAETASMATDAATAAVEAEKALREGAAAEERGGGGGGGGENRARAEG